MVLTMSSLFTKPFFKHKSRLYDQKKKKNPHKQVISFSINMGNILHWTVRYTFKYK